MLKKILKNTFSSPKTPHALLAVVALLVVFGVSRVGTQSELDAYNCMLSEDGAYQCRSRSNSPMDFEEYVYTLEKRASYILGAQTGELNGIDEVYPRLERELAQIQKEYQLSQTGVSDRETEELINSLFMEKRAKELRSEEIS